MSGLWANNDRGNVLISSDANQITYSHTMLHDFNVSNTDVMLGREDGTFSVWSRTDTVSVLHNIGIVQAGLGGRTIMGKHSGISSPDLKVYEHIFTSKPSTSSGVGLQLFNASGIEVFNSDKPLLSIIDKITIDPEVAYRKEFRNANGVLVQDRTFWEKSYPNHSNLGLMFTNVPAGIMKEAAYYQIFGYAYNFRTSGNTINIAFRSEYAFWSGTSRVITLDESVRFEFFVIDLSNVA